VPTDVPTDAPTDAPTPTPPPTLAGTATLILTGTSTLVPTGTATLVATGTATLVPTGTATLVPTGTATLVPTGTATPLSTDTPLPARTATHTPTWTPEPSPAPTDPAPANWDLAREVIGMWEYIEGDWRYYFDFFPDGRVLISENGIRPYQVRDDRTLVIQMMTDEWEISVLDLTPEHLTLKGVADKPEQYNRVYGTPNLAAEIAGLWLDVSEEYPSLDLSENGIVVSEFGRGAYEVMSDNSVLVTCDVTAKCGIYLEYGQPDDAPLALRVYEIADDQLTLQGFGYSQRWTLDHRDGQDNLAAGIVGRWVDEENDVSVEFTAYGDWIVDDTRHGSYEALSSSTLWTEFEGTGQALVVTELTADELIYAEWGLFDEAYLWVFKRDAVQ
jgi:hypothetical protein